MPDIYSSEYRAGTEENTEKGYLVGVHIKGSRPLLNVQDSLDELERLAETANVDVVGRSSQQLSQINPATMVGSGKTIEIQEELEMLGADVVIFDDELSPRHQRELEKIFGEDIKVIDRSALILDIFARHAQTREGSLQVELAQYEYRLPRLTRQWTHLARQAGGGAARGGAVGVGLRGPGETQLEVDRREISRRISKLKRDIETVRAHRGRYRSQRKQAGIPVVALVGYTNAGKSTLLNALTDSDIYTADQLFATLDPTTRRVDLPGSKTVLVSDTVGFIQKLPTTLIAAFRATLEEIAEAAVLLHVADASHPNVSQHIESVEDTLAALDLPPQRPRLLALNKIDRDPDILPALVESLQGAEYEAILPISAKTGAGIGSLLQTIEGMLTSVMQYIHVVVPFARGDIAAQIHERGIVLEERHTAEGHILKAQVPYDLAAQIIAVNVITDISSE